MPATTRRILLAAPFLGAAPALAQGVGSFDGFLEGVRAEARRTGISATTIQRTLSGLQPNMRVIELDRRQPERGGMAWSDYRDRIVSQTRMDNGRRLAAENRSMLQSLEARYRVPYRIMLAIWGMESNYGTNTGGFGVVESLATLAWDGRRSSYFRGELMAALRILDGGHISVERMRGSWAGAMGQPQFMPTSFERLAVDADGDGRKDIWDNRADALGSIGNYLGRNGWREGEPWGNEVLIPASFDAASATRENVRPLRDWSRQGVTLLDGRPLPATDATGAILVPGYESGTLQAFIVHHNFNVIRRYNSPNFYALAVGMLSDRVA